MSLHHFVHTNCINQNRIPLSCACRILNFLLTNTKILLYFVDKQQFSLTTDQVPILSDVYYIQYKLSLLFTIILSIQFQSQKYSIYITQLSKQQQVYNQMCITIAMISILSNIKELQGAINGSTHKSGHIGDKDCLQSRHSHFIKKNIKFRYVTFMTCH